MTKTAIISGTVTLNLTTDASGNTMAWCIPYNAFGANSFASGVSYGTSFVAYNPTGLVPSQGTYSGINFIAGPLVGLALNIQAYRLSSFSVRMTPITSVNNTQGNIQIGLYADLNITTVSGVPPISQAAYPLNAFYQSGNLMTSYRSVYPCNGIYDLFPQASATGNAGADTTLYSILITGATPNTQVVKLDLSYCYEITPSPASASLSFSDFPEIGPSTLEALCSAFTINPGLQMLDLKASMDICTMIQDLQNPNYENVVNTTAVGVLKHYKHKEMPIYSNIEPSNADSEISFD